MNDPDDFGFYVKKLAQDNPVESGPGESGYFSAPSASLDPHLFDGEKIKPPVRRMLLDTFNHYMVHKGYHNVPLWTRLFLAGSGITYQWSAGRDNGDLDVLLGFDYVQFMYNNENFRGLDEDEVADHINEELHNELWPKTAETDINGQTYEVTYYLNPGTGMDITNIHPYAAYDVSQNKWVVRPPDLPQDPSTLYSKDWFSKAKQDKSQADSMSAQYNYLLNQLNSFNPGSPGYVNVSTKIKLLTRQAKDLFDDIHLGRKAAFAEGGTGYGDWHNFRWQVAKGTGAVKTLHALSTIDAEAHQAQDKDLYGGEIDAASKALSRAALNRWKNK